MDQQMVITGNEVVDNESSALFALSQFYRAFNQQDMALMERNWSSGNEVVMSNPLGGIKHGWNEISQVYERIFNGPAEVYVEFYDFNVIQSEHMFCTAGRERGYFRLDDQEISLAIRTSRVYSKQKDRWRQVHHHGSIADTTLLARYQDAVINQIQTIEGR